MPHLELDYLQFKKKKVSLLITPVNLFMYYSTFLEQRTCPSQHSGTKMKSAAGAGEIWGRGVAIAFS